MASSLQIFFSNRSGPTHLLWSWDQAEYHRVAFVVEQLGDNIFLAYIGPVGDAPTNRVVLKIALTPKAQRRLQREYEVYTGPLLHLQGSVIPRCYGLFNGTSGKAFVNCLILEHISPHKERAVDPEEFHRQLMLALCKIHQAGVNHGNLKTGHILQMGYSPRIVDFSIASLHLCKRGHPATHSGAYYSQVSCEELSMAEVFHAKDRDGIVRHLHRLAAKRGADQLSYVGKLQPSAGCAPSFAQFASFSRTSVPPYYAPPVTGIKDDRRRSGKAARKRGRSMSRTGGQHQTKVHSSLSSRRFSIPIRLDFQPMRPFPIAINNDLPAPSSLSNYIAQFSIPSYNPQPRNFFR